MFAEFALPFQREFVFNEESGLYGRLAPPEQPLPPRKPELEVGIMAARHSKHVGLVPAVAYLRMSDKSQDKSIPAQIEEIEKYAAAHGFEIVRWYRDDGISGAESTKRAGFQRLILDAQQNPNFDVVLVWD
jgi:hypothetical protein